MPLPALTPSMLGARYAIERASIQEARRTARDVGDRDRAKALTRFLRPGRTFLYFDPRGTGRAICATSPTSPSAGRPM
ncbi:hypothetical protein [Actinomadura sp. NBRC 104412]|uniref:hypothetical protein n=1 Tax=Actinomadura sp. NBRC 104412 TaxID=3032203 RepID=UPI00255288CE|nr:hypothetical protein [Actinomadura sp. NBRC 104412]